MIISDEEEDAKLGTCLRLGGDIDMARWMEIPPIWLLYTIWSFSRFKCPAFRCDTNKPIQH